MEYGSIINSLLALTLVLGLIALTSALLRKYGANATRVSCKSSKGAKRLQVVESLVVDGRRKLVLLRRDDKEHLVMLSLDKETIIESDIEIPKEISEKEKLEVMSKLKGKS